MWIGAFEGAGGCTRADEALVAGGVRADKGSVAGDIRVDMLVVSCTSFVMSFRGCLRGLPLFLGASAAAEAAASLLSALAAAEPFFGAGFFAGALCAGGGVAGELGGRGAGTVSTRVSEAAIVARGGGTRVGALAGGRERGITSPVARVIGDAVAGGDGVGAILGMVASGVPDGWGRGRAVGSEIPRPSAEANGLTALGLGKGELATVRRLCSAHAAMVPRGTLFPTALLYAGRGGGRVYV